jgi:hypothetical protein
MRQIGEAPAAGDDGVELGQLLVATMVAAFGDELARDLELLPRFLSERGRRGGVGQNGSWWARLDEAGERKPRAFKRAIAPIQSHFSRFGDLFCFVKVAFAAIQIAGRAAESGAGEQAARD